MTRYTFTVEPVPVGFVAYLGEYDMGAHIATGDAPAEAIGDWLAMWGETLPEGGVV